MLHKSYRLVMLTLLILLSIGQSNPVNLLAQNKETCDIDALLEHQQEHAAAISDLEHLLHDDLDAALENLYVTGVAYQALAVGCGFNPIEEVSAAHSDDHSMEEHDRTAILEVARSIGDPENGEVLFNAFQTEVNFACATCHRVDTTERLIGPGLLGVGNPEHDPSEHDMSTMDTSESDDHNEGETEGGIAMDHHGMDMGTSGGNDDHMMDLGSDMGDDPAAYIRESILHPSAFLVPGFPDNLMPKTYGEIFTDDEINDLVAYLMTLQ